jgi:RNA polymerase sigma-70 factor (ECF subfamily)
MQLTGATSTLIPSDAELVARVLAEDRAACAALIRRHNQRLYRVAWSLSESRAEAEDVVQESWVIAFQCLAQLEDRTRFRAWLTRVVVNEGLRRRRHEQRRREFDDEETDSMNADNPEVLVARRELRPILEVAIASLPEALRSAFVLREIEGMTVADVAEALGVPEATVKTRAFRAREQLRRRITDWSDSALPGILQFAGERCAEMAARVMARLESASDERH